MHLSLPLGVWLVESVALTQLMPVKIPILQNYKTGGNVQFSRLSCGDGASLDLCYTGRPSHALELTTISETFENKHPWQNAILIVALSIALPALAKTHGQGIQQSLQEIANSGINLQQSVRSQAAQAECGTTDFTFDKLRAQPAGYGFTRITGRITNNCAEAKGAQIKITTYNRAGDVLSDNDIWPAGINNIPANSEFPFEWLDTNAVFARFTVTIISVKSWPTIN